MKDPIIYFLLSYSW